MSYIVVLSDVRTPLARISAGYIKVVRDLRSLSHTYAPADAGSNKRVLGSHSESGRRSSIGGTSSTSTSTSSAPYSMHACSFY